MGVLVLLKAVAYWLDRYRLLSHTRSGKAVHGCWIPDINAVLPAKLILLAIAVICAAAVFSALFLRDLRIPGIGLVLLVLSSLIVGAGWPLVVEQISVKAECGAEKSDYIRRSITATRQAYGLTNDVVQLPRLQRECAGDGGSGGCGSGDDVEHPCAGSDHHRACVPQFQQGKNFYYFPDQLSIDRYQGPDGNLRDYVVAARELNPTA